jgi:lambda family phage portal protein
MNVATTILARAIVPFLPSDLGRRVRLAVNEVERQRAAVDIVRAYEAAGFGPRWTPQTMMPAPVTETHGAASLIGSRVAFQIVNQPYMAAIKNAVVTDLVGPDGPSLQHPDPVLVELWNRRFWSTCDAEGISTLAHLIGRAAISWLCNGNAIILMNVDPDDGSLKLLLVNPEQVDASFNEDYGDRGWAMHGIWVARDGRRVRYRILRTPPDHPFATTAADATWRDAVDVIHIHDPTFPGEVWGVSPLAAILTRAVEVDAAEDAGLMLQKVAALLSVFLSDPSGSVDLGAIAKPGKLAEASLEPGVIRVLPEGVTATTVTPPKSDSLVDFIKHMVRSLATGVGLPAWQVSGDLSDVNFSSARLGALNWRRRAQSLQRNLLVGQFLDRVFARWVALETIAGRLNVDLDDLAPPTWLFPGWPAVDILKEVEADVLAVSAGIKSRAEVISANGRDPEIVRAEIKRDPVPPPAAPAQNPRSIQNA